MSRGTRGALYAGGAVALVLAVSVITPAIGGSGKSLRKQVQQLQKQVAAIQKQQGPQGPQGTPGQTGSQGVTGQTGSQGVTGQTGAQGPPALKLDFKGVETDDDNTPLGTQNELSLFAECDASLANQRTTTRWNVRSSVAAEIQLMSSDDAFGTSTVVDNTGQALSANTLQGIKVLIAPLGAFGRAEIQAVYRNANRVISINLHMVADDGTGDCQLFGTAVPAG